MVYSKGIMVWRALLFRPLVFLLLALACGGAATAASSGAVAIWRDSCVRFSHGHVAGARERPQVWWCPALGRVSCGAFFRSAPV